MTAPIISPEARVRGRFNPINENRRLFTPATQLQTNETLLFSVSIVA